MNSPESLRPRPARNYRTHLKMGPIGGTGLVLLFLWELVRALPVLLQARLSYRKLQRQGQNTSPRIAWVSGNLDEVNGIALSSRKLLVTLRQKQKPIWLYGVAFHDKPPRSEGDDQSVVLAPGIFSIDQAGYASSELALVNLEHFAHFLITHQINLVEFETPSPVELACLYACRIIGIRTCSHYRTDIFTYSEMLVDNVVGVWCIQFSTRWFTRLAGPVVVPSEAYRAKVASMGVRPHRIHKLARGVDHLAFHPQHRQLAEWSALGLPATPSRLLYVGRISKEKNLETLVEALILIALHRKDFHLAVVGDGPYRDEMENRLKPYGCASFTGVLSGTQLNAIYADADLFVFPSTTDTFGNSVVEALASGLPCLVSDEGGPCEIVREGNCGFIFSAKYDKSLEQTLEHALNHRSTWEDLRIPARMRAQNYTFDHSASEFWNFYLNQISVQEEMKG